MTEKKVREAEKSSLVISFNSKEECLLKKKMLSLEAMKKQAMESMCLDQKVLYNRFILKLRRSELAHARLVGNKEMIRSLTQSMFSNYNTTLNDGTEEAMRAMLRTSKPIRAASAPCRPMSGWSNKSKYTADISHGMRTGTSALDFRSLNSNRKSLISAARLKSAPLAQAARDKHVKYHALETLNSLSINQKCQNVKEGAEVIHRSQDMAAMNRDRHTNGISWPENNSQLLRRPKTAGISSDTAELESEGHLLQTRGHSFPKSMDFDRQFKLFIEKVKSMQQEDSVLRDYYSDRLLDGAGKRETVLLPKDEEERRQWLPVGEESHHRSVTLKQLDRNFSKTDVPQDILYMEQYNLVLTKENFTVRNWHNNDPYETGENL
ncbi:hypothetical protein XENTR_v10006343 [Xenopus tropicalis]|nr:hypothetical protein XENTR_v10006343 [Xenopus tropicalis]